MTNMPLQYCYSKISVGYHLKSISAKLTDRKLI